MSACLHLGARVQVKGVGGAKQVKVTKDALEVAPAARSGHAGPPNSHSIPKPQQLFEDRVDNSTAPFRPKVWQRRGVSCHASRRGAACHLPLWSRIG